jgi:hypothetical protein
MIVVSVELHSAISGRIKLLGRMCIANVGTSPDGKLGTYTVRVGRKTDAGDLHKVFKSPLRHGIVANYPRLSHNIWRLVLRALAVSFPEQRVELPDADAPQDDPEFKDGN